jgi:hypothetical protein
MQNGAKIQQNETGKFAEPINNLLGNATTYGYDLS